MKSLIKPAIIGTLVLGAATIWGCGGDDKPAPPVVEVTDNQLPRDAQDLCPLTDSAFNTWFPGGKPKENGFVFPANSVTFVSNQTNCSFYQWSEQMFLWITSPAVDGGYPAGTGTVLESPTFYTVEPEVNGQRNFIPHEPGKPIRVMSSISQRGVNNLPIIHDKMHRTYELDTISDKKNIKLRTVTAAGTEAEIARVEKDAAGKPKFFDKANKEIVSPKAVIAPNFKHPEHIVRKLVVNGVNVFLSNKGPVDVETAQASGDGLMSQDGGIVYYTIFANDVYAWFQYAYVNHMMPDTTFPTDSASRSIICSLARKNGVTLRDSNALAMELKASWIETKYVKDSNEFINITAVVPEYNKTAAQWLPNGKERTARLSMVGLHIVGSTNKHPEMIWATYEYKKNTPNESYQYLDTKGATKTAPRSDTKGWLFCNGDQKWPVDSFNNSHIAASGDTLSAKTPYGTISASNSLLLFPFGSSTLVPNPLVTSAAMSNSQVISSNNAIQRMLPGKDKRKNYILIGAEWTDGGYPNGNNYPADKSPNSAIGTSVLANSTMETYVQQGFNGTDSINGGCFNCHQGSLNPSAANDLSHIFSLLPNALPPVPAAIKK